MPWLTFLYVSATATLAEKQLFFIKNILTSRIYQKYWPDMIHKDEGRRTRWTSSEIIVDHPRRHLENVRDPSIIACGLTKTITGLHFNIGVLDDVVVPENAYTEDGREKVADLYSFLASIETTESEEWVVGTRYDQNDLYGKLMQMKYPKIDTKTGEVISEDPIYEVFEKQVEDQGDGLGEFLWPRQQRADGRWFGFDAEILATKKAKYLNKSHFYAQYYNNPSDPEGKKISPSKFQYYERKHIVNKDGNVYFKDRKLAVYAAMDFAWSLGKRADYTAIIVIGMDCDSNIYVLDIARFKTDKISDYYDNLEQLYRKWGFRKLRAETNAAQAVIVRDLKENYIKPRGMVLVIDEFRRTKNQGTKEERFQIILEPRYENQQIWHYKGGNCQTLEEELITARPAHDDIKDCLCAAIEIALPPRRSSQYSVQSNIVPFNSRFGGVTFR
jgi:hypothetical protein